MSFRTLNTARLIVTALAVKGRLKPLLQAIALLTGLLLFLSAPLAAQTEPTTTYVTQRFDTPAHLARKYLADAALAETIIAANQTQFETLSLELTPETLLPPGLLLTIPLTPPAIPTSDVQPTSTTPPPSPPVTGPEPSGKIAFSFFNRALSRRVWEIDLINVDGSGRTVFRWNQVSEPALSPDGAFLAFRGWQDTGHVLSVGPLSAERYWPIGGFQEDSRIDWSHDGSRLVFASQREGDRLWRLYFIHADGTRERVLSRADGLPLFGEDPAWSHRDDRIIYKGCAPDGNQCGIWFVTLDGAVAAPIVIDPQAIQPDGSPTAERVVFASARSGNWELYTVNIDGSDLRQLTDHPAIDGLPVWSPDGEWIAFQSTRPGFAPDHDFEQGPSQGGQQTEDSWGIWIIRQDGSDLRQIFAFDGGLMRANRLDLPYGGRDWFDEQISWGR